MIKYCILQQSLSTKVIGGTGTEFLSLAGSSLTKKYDFVNAVLNDYRTGVTPHDIKFYYHKIKEATPDIIHIRGAGPDGLNAVIGAKLAGKCKILVTVHGMYSDLVYISKVKRFISKHIIERLTFLLADGISCVCKAADRRPYFDRYRKKMLPFVYNRMPKFHNEKKTQYRREIREQYHIPDEAVVALYIGRITKEKGLDYLIESIKSCQHSLPDDFVMMIVGDGDFITQIREESKELPVRTIFIGAQNHVEPFYHAADFFIQPSLHENHSIALLEASAAELPCIATDCGGNCEIVRDHESGLIVPVADPAALSNAIMEMCDSSLRTTFSNTIHSMSFNEFSDSEVDQALDQVYQALLNS